MAVVPVQGALESAVAGEIEVDGVLLAGAGVAWHGGYPSYDG